MSIVEPLQFPSTAGIPDLLTETQAAKILQVSAYQLGERRRAGLAPQHVEVGRFIRYTPAAIEAYIQAQTVPSRVAA